MIKESRLLIGSRFASEPNGERLDRHPVMEAWQFRLEVKIL